VCRFELFLPCFPWGNAGLNEEKHKTPDRFTSQAPEDGLPSSRNTLPGPENHDLRAHFFLVREIAKKIDLGGWL
jgi:hypothetical protein